MGTAVDSRAEPDAWKQKRQTILDAAFAVMMERGYRSTSALDIATRAKVSKRDLYQLFENKEAILAACIAARARRMRRDLELPRPTGAREFESVLVAFGTTFLLEMTHSGVVTVYRLAITDCERSPEVAHTLDAYGRDSSRAALVALLRHGQEVGLLNSGDATVMASRYFGILMGDLVLRVLMRVADAPGEAAASKRARDATEALMLMYGAQPRTKRRSSKE
jgi:AcrR family transcriptional regulator